MTMANARFFIYSALAAVVVAVAEAIFVAGNKPDGFIFSRYQAALWAGFFVLLVVALLHWLLSEKQDQAAAVPPAPAPAPSGPPGPPAPPAAAAGVATNPRRRGIKALVIGFDGRTSTSKLQAVLWTGAILYALTFLLLAGRILHEPSGCGGPGQPLCAVPDATLQGIFDNVVDQPLQAEYFALLGLPLGAALASKALVSNKVAKGELIQPASQETGVVTGIAEVVSNDAGTIDVLDFQYAAFNLLTLFYFFVRLFTHLEDGLPAIPVTLLTLSGVSVAAYTTKKALESDVVRQITSVSPPKIILGDTSTLNIVASGFVSSGGTTDLNKVYLDGRLLDATWTATTVKATIPTDSSQLAAKGFRALDLADLIVYDDMGQASEPYKIKIEEGGEPP